MTSTHNVIRRSLLHRISYTSLERLLQHLFADADLPTTWSERADWCYAALTRVDSPLPPSVRDVFEGLNALSTEGGGHILLKVAAAQSVDVVARFGAVSREDRAVLTYLEHPAVFFLARERALAFEVPASAFVIFAGPSASWTTIDDVTRRNAQMEAMLTVWHRSAGRPGRPSIRVENHGSFFVLDIVASGLPTNGVGFNGERAPSAPFQDAVILLDPRQRFAAIRTDSRDDLDFYRSLAGVALAGSAEALYSAPIVMLPSLITRGMLDELEVPVPGLESVRVHQAELGLKEHGSIFVSRDALVRGTWGREFLSMLNGSAKLTLALRPWDSGPAYALHVAPPDEVRFDHRAVGAQALQLLQVLQLLRV